MSNDATNIKLENLKNIYRKLEPDETQFQPFFCVLFSEQKVTLCLMISDVLVELIQLH